MSRARHMITQSGFCNQQFPPFFSPEFRIKRADKMKLMTSTAPISTKSLFSVRPKTRLNSIRNSTVQPKTTEATTRPTMADILTASKAQNLDLQLKTVGPFFRITAKNMETQNEVGRAEGFIRLWFNGKILHLDSIRLRRETLGMEKSIFGIGLFIGAVAIRYGYDCGCDVAQLLAINDSDYDHSKLVKFYTRIGFKSVYEVTGSSIGDLAHMLLWGGIGTRMDADIEDLLDKWCTRFKR